VDPEFANGDQSDDDYHYHYHYYYSIDDDDDVTGFAVELPRSA
jgi:hypothetical protein